MIPGQAVTEASQPRYAIYFAPPAASRLWRLAQAWLGRDCESDERLAQPAVDGWTAEQIAAATESPQLYGFHATLKAPFRLAPGVSLRDLHDKLAAFASLQQPFLAPPLKVSAIGPFIALTLSAPSSEMQALAAAAVQDFDSFRAAPAPHDLERRLGKGLTPRQQELLHLWGYPYVLEEFRFHMTLTGPLAETARRERLQVQLATLFGPALTEPVPVREISLYSQASAERPFLLAERFRFGGAPASDGHSGQEQTTA
jgi:putative phosphonate metabolism protein